MTANILATIFARNAFITDILFFAFGNFSFVILLQFSSIPVRYSHGSHMQQSFHHLVGPVRHSCFRVLGNFRKNKRKGLPRHNS